ncbi:MAG: hypothetical protein ABIT01_15080 [Thermoanaerobaculia bacterium]
MKRAILVPGVLLGMLGCTSIVGGFSGRNEACRIIAIGTSANATIVRLIDTGTTINQDPVVDFVLRVNGEVGESWEAHSKALVGRLDVASLQPGRVVPVKFDPKERTRVAMDLWECKK